MIEYLEQCATSILDAAVDGLAEATTNHPPPAEAFISHGPPAADFCCEGGQVTVHLESIDYTTGRLSREGSTIPQATCVFLGDAAWVITLFRCVPVIGAEGYAPSAGVQDASAADLLTDLYAIITEVIDRAKECTLIPNQLQNCQGITLDGAVPTTPSESGGCGGWEIRLTTRLNDPGPVGS